MGYSMEELFDDAVKPAKDLSDLVGRLCNSRRQDWVARFIEELAMRVTDHETAAGAFRDILMTSCNSADEACIVSRRMGGLEVAGAIPEGVKITVTTELK